MPCATIIPSRGGPTFCFLGLLYTFYLHTEFQKSTAHDIYTYTYDANGCSNIYTQHKWLFQQLHTTQMVVPTVTHNTKRCLPTFTYNTNVCSNSYIQHKRLFQHKPTAQMVCPNIYTQTQIVAPPYQVRMQHKPCVRTHTYYTDGVCPRY